MNNAHPTEIFNKIELSWRITKQYLQGLPWLGCLGWHTKNNMTTHQFQLFEYTDNNWQFMSCTCREKAATE